MDPRHQEILRVNHVFLVENLDLTQPILQSYLVQEHLLTANDLERLTCSHLTKKDMASEFLLHILRRRGPTAFERFLQCLVQADLSLEFIANQLDPTAVERYRQH